MAVQSNKGMPERKHESSHHNQQPLPLDPTTGVNASSHRPVGALQPDRHHLGTVAGFKSVRVAGFKSEDLAGFVGIRNTFAPCCFATLSRSPRRR